MEVVWVWVFVSSIRRALSGCLLGWLLAAQLFLVEIVLPWVAANQEVLN